MACRSDGPTDFRFSERRRAASGRDVLIRCYAPAGEETGAGASPLPAAKGSRPEVLDREALQRLFELDPQGKGKLIERVVQAFGTSTERMLPQLRSAEQTGDARAVKLVAHTLKSSSASLGATDLSRMCADLEQQMRNGIPADVGAQIERIAAEIGVVIQALKVMMESAP